MGQQSRKQKSNDDTIVFLSLVVFAFMALLVLLLPFRKVSPQFYSFEEGVFSVEEKQTFGPANRESYFYRGDIDGEAVEFSSGKRLSEGGTYEVLYPKGSPEKMIFGHSDESFWSLYFREGNPAALVICFLLFPFLCYLSFRCRPWRKKPEPKVVSKRLPLP